MGATIAIVRPETDATEVTMSSWAAAYLAAIAGDPDVSLRHDIAGRTATQAAISAAAQSVDALLYYGHGRKDRLGDTTTLVDSSNYSDYKDKVLVAVACLAGDRFGPDVVGTGGAKGFLGFDDILIVYKGQASLFGGVFERALLALSQQGGTLKTASDVLQKGFRDLENYFLNDPKGRTHPDAAIIWLGAHINYRGAVLYGQPSLNYPPLMRTRARLMRLPQAKATRRSRLSSVRWVLNPWKGVPEELRSRTMRSL
jgi:hypothetical protein